jgi:hypothetical protein
VRDHSQPRRACVTGGPGGPAQAANGVTVSTFPLEFSFFNPCTNENVDFSGTGLSVIDPTPEDNHGLIGHGVDIAIKGVGETTGTRYVALFAADNGAYVETNPVHSRLIAPGPANDLVFAIVFHIAINANGEVVGWHNRVTFEACV